MKALKSVFLLSSGLHRRISRDGTATLRATTSDGVPGFLNIYKHERLKRIKIVLNTK